MLKLSSTLPIGVHNCPGGDHDLINNSYMDFADLIPDLLKLNAANFYMQMASKANPERVLTNMKNHLKPQQRIYVVVIDVIDPVVEDLE